MKTGEAVASLPVLDDLPEGYQAAVENSAIVYNDGNGTVSTIMCSWFGARLANPDGDSASWQRGQPAEHRFHAQCPQYDRGLRMNNLSGSAAEGKRRAYGADGRREPIASEIRSITDKNGQAEETLENGAPYELRVTVADNGALDLNETAKEIKASVILGK